MNDAPAPLRRFRFGLRTLLVVVTLAAVASWSYVVGRPWWQGHLLSVEFEDSAKQLKVGMTVAAASHHIGYKAGTHGSASAYDAKGNQVVLSQYAWPNTIYCIYYVIPQSPNGNPYDGSISSLEVFRLPIRPPGNRGQYMQEFFKFLSGDRKNNPGFQYELIYSDPPAKPEAK